MLDEQYVNFGEMGKPLPSINIINRKTLGDLLTIGDHYYRVENISNDLLTLQKIDKNARTVGVRWVSLPPMLKHARSMVMFYN